MGFATCRLAMVVGVAAVFSMLRLAPVQAQDGCPSGTAPVFNTATQSIVCIADRDASCPPGQTPTYNMATQSIVCIGSGGGDDGRPPQAQCPSGQAALRTDDGTLRCVDLSLNPVHPCAAPDRAYENGVCVWTCGDGTRPDEASGRCVCQPGLIEAGLDADGRPTCRIDTRATIPVPNDRLLLEQPPGLFPQPAPGQ